ncbi:putative glycolipid-binding domain-containing protein [Actinomadura sp.]|uniref:putative glycolipid-binding domain-containing protein n=1 Tax=Actinomadura sp. TaxID=1989 RepID=UPI0037CA8C71
MAGLAFDKPPEAAAWRHLDARDGFEVLQVSSLRDGWRLHGTTAAVEDGVAWAVRYVIQVDERWRTRTARISHLLDGGPGEVTLEQADGRWLVNGRPDPGLDGCLDVDLESSAMTNTLPVHRLDLAEGAAADAPAVYARAADLAVGRLEQTYARVAGGPGRQRYDYAAPAFGFTALLVYDGSGFVVDYPGLAVRCA